MHNPFARFFRARDKPNKQASPQDAVSAAPGFYYGTSLAGKSVTPTSAIQVSAVYACVRVIAETVASLPLHVYEATDTGSRKAVLAYSLAPVFLDFMGFLASALKCCPSI